MDVNEFWQENKRWVLGCLLGLVVYFVGKSVISGIYDTGDITAEQGRILTGARSDEALYNGNARDAALDEGEALADEVERLRAALEFHPAAEYELKGKGMAPGDFLTREGRRLQKDLTDRADALDVDLLGKDLQWPSAVGVEEIRAALLGLDVIDQACNRLLSAHERLLEAEPDAQGVRAISSFKVEMRPGRRVGPPQRNIDGRGRRRPAIDPGELLAEQRVSFSFQADAAVTLMFLEALRDPANPLVLDGFSAAKPARPGDPLTVRGTLAAVLFIDEEE